MIFIAVIVFITALYIWIIVEEDGLNIGQKLRWILVVLAVPIGGIVGYHFELKRRQRKINA